MNKFITVLAICAGIVGVAYSEDAAWSFEQKSPGGFMTVAGDSVFCGDGMENLVCLSVKSGEERWRASIGANIVQGATASRGNIYITACAGTFPDRNTFSPVYAMAIDMESHEVQWKTDLSKGMSRAPIVVDDSIIVGAGPRVYILSKTDGSARSEYKHPGGPVTGVSLSGKTIAAASANGLVAGINIDSGDELWQRPLDGPCFMTPLPVDDRFVVGSLKGTVYALSAADGSPSWSTQVDGGLEVMAARNSKSVFFGTRHGKVYALNQKDGSIAWTRDEGKPRQQVTVFGIIGASEDYVAISTRDSRVLVMNPADGETLWEYDAEEPLANFAISENMIVCKSFGGTKVSGSPIP